MTLEELKAEAEKLGYSVVPKAVPLGRVSACTCGHKHLWHANYYNREKKETEYWINCPRCHKKGPVVTRGEGEFGYRKDRCQAAAVKAWNEMIAKEKEEAST